MNPKHDEAFFAKMRGYRTQYAKKTIDNIAVDRSCQQTHFDRFVKKMRNEQEHSSTLTENKLSSQLENEFLPAVLHELTKEDYQVLDLAYGEDHCNLKNADRGKKIGINANTFEKRRNKAERKVHRGLIYMKAMTRKGWTHDNPLYQLVCVLIIQGKSLTSVSKECGFSEGQIKKMVDKAREELRELLTPESFGWL